MKYYRLQTIKKAAICIKKCIARFKKIGKGGANDGGNKQRRL